MNHLSTVTLRSGREMPALGLGTWELTDDTAGTVATALRLGYRLIDTSSDYGTQPGIGEALANGGASRERVFVVTKVEEDDDAYERMRDNLRQLRLGHVDLALIHRPPPRGPGVELWQGLARARADGLVLDIGVSNYSTDRIDALAEAVGEMPAVNQIEWSPFGWSGELLEHARRNGIVVQAYSPLTRAHRLDEDTVARIAARHDRTPAQVLLRWNLQHEVATVPKANREEHLRENLGALEFELTEDDMRELDGCNEHWSSLGTLPYV